MPDTTITSSDMQLFDVYPRYPIEPVRGTGCTIVDADGREYLDFYGGHAVISIGHGHPRFVRAIAEQAERLAFYSNSVVTPLQETLAERLGAVSGYEDYRLFLCNSGAEANENALKLASFHNGGSTVIAFERGFHGRTSLAVAVTDNPSIQAPINRTHDVRLLPLNDADAFTQTFESERDLAAVIIEGIQGIGGIHEPEGSFLRLVAHLCHQRGVPLVLDEVQSGYGRSGAFFAHQHHDVRPDLITVAKGMGNGFPVGGVLIAPHFEGRHGLLGTTFGGSHLACAAALAVLDAIEEEALIGNAAAVGGALIESLSSIEGVLNVRGRGLMIGVEVENAAAVRERLLFAEHVFTGSSSDGRTIRLLPPLSIGMTEAEIFIDKLARSLQSLEAA